MDFTVDVPEAGTYDLSVFANSWNRYPAVQAQGPTNVFLRVNGAAEQELCMPLGYKWVVWDHADTTGDVIVDKIDLSLPDPAAPFGAYEAEHAELDGTRPDHSATGVSGAGVVPLTAGSTTTFWVYSDEPGEKTLTVDARGTGTASLVVNGHAVADLAAATDLPVFLREGVNKVVLVGGGGELSADRVVVTDTQGTLVTRWVEAEDGTVAGAAAVRELSLASGGRAVGGVGGEPGNGNTLTLPVEAPSTGTHMVTVRYSNPEQSPSTHYNPDPLARFANITVNGEETVRVGFPHSFHQNNFWELAFPVDLVEGDNTLTFAAEEKPNFGNPGDDEVTYASDTWPDVLLRSQFAPIVDRVGVTPLVAATGPDLAVTADMSARCVVGRAVQTVTLTNGEDVEVSVEVASPYGTRTVTSLAPGRSESYAFSTRRTSFDAGTATVYAEAVRDGETVTSSTSVAFEGYSCR